MRQTYPDPTLLSELRAAASSAALLEGVSGLLTRAANAVESFFGVPAWSDPQASWPPFDTRILAVIGSWRDDGRGLKLHRAVHTITIKCADADGDTKAGREMRDALYAMSEPWEDLQFLILDDEWEIMKFYSDSIVFWAPMPKFPDECAKVATD